MRPVEGAEDSPAAAKEAAAALNITKGDILIGVAPAEQPPIALPRWKRARQPAR